MEESNSHKPSKKQIISVVSILLLLVGIVTGVYLSLRPQIFINKAAPEDNLEIISPDPNEAIDELMVVRAVTPIEADINNLRAIIKIDETLTENMRVSKSDTGKIALSTAIRTVNYENGEHSLEIFLYDESSETPTLVGNSKVKFNVEN